jgi:hypothetical protein
MRDIKNWIYLNISVEITNNKEDSLNPEFSNKELVQSDPKKIKINSTVTEKFENSNSSKDYVVGGDMNLAKHISIEDFGFITKATPQGFLINQIIEGEPGFTVYR